MNYQQLAEKIIKKAIKYGADEAEVYIGISRDFQLAVRHEDVDNITQSTSKGLGLLIYKDKRLSFSYSSDFSDPSIDSLIKKTLQLSQVAEPAPWNRLPDFDMKKEIQNLDLFDPSIPILANEKKLEIAKKVEKIALTSDKRITKSSGGYFQDRNMEIFIVNSKGLSRSLKTTDIFVGVEIIAGEGNNMQSGYWDTYKRHFSDLDSIENVAKTAARRAIAKLGARSVPTQKVPVVFENCATSEFWRGILGAMNGDSVFKKITFLGDLLNKPIASPLITVVDDPCILRHTASVPFDGEGKITRKNTLIDQGTIKMFIYSTKTARKAGVDVHTITRRRGHRNPPKASYLNVIVENGKTPREKMISEIKEGFFVQELRDRGTDTSTGNYSCGASGYWIKNGELAFPVDGVVLGGNVLELLKNIDAVANDLEIRETTNSPSFRISEITVGGK